MIMMRDAESAASESRRGSLCAIRAGESRRDSHQPIRHRRSRDEWQISLTSDAQADPRFTGGTVILQGVRSVAGGAARSWRECFRNYPMPTAFVRQSIYRRSFEGPDHVGFGRRRSALKNARLTEEQMERERFEREQQVAGEIRQRFCRSTQPHIMVNDLQGISFPVTRLAGII